MWQPKAVERALFCWLAWKQSIVRQWIKTANSAENVDVLDVKKTARKELGGLKFPNSLWLQLYWICCTYSKCNFDYPGSFERIVVPEWLPMPFDPSMDQYHLKSGMRMYAPAVWDKSDAIFYARHHGYSVGENGFFVRFVGEEKPVINTFPFVTEFDYKIFVSSDHEFNNVLSIQRGRPNKSKRIGGLPSYSDRLAVQCTVLKDDFNKTYEDIAGIFGLPITKPYESAQSDTARHLVDIGRKLLKILG